MPEQSQLLEAVAAVAGRLALPEEISGAVRAALAVLGEALAASCVAVEEFNADSEGLAPEARPRFEWRAAATRSARQRAAPRCPPLALPLAARGVPLGHLRVEPGSLRSVWTPAEETAVRAVAAALAGALLQERHRDRLRSTLHGLRTPLTAILAVSDIVRRYGTRLSDEEKGREMEKIQTQVRAMTQLLDDSSREQAIRARPAGR
jgi:K+-sensing histidine kinase KdpD